VERRDGDGDGGGGGKGGDLCSWCLRRVAMGTRLARLDMSELTVD